MRPRPPVYVFNLYEKEILVIKSAEDDARFNGKPILLNGQKIYFYAGSVLRDQQENQ